MINLLAIVGQTAGGKSALALEIAAGFPAEIIAADSKTIYKGLDIGTAKPTPAERALVRHHLLDVVQPREAFNVSQFQQRALAALEEIRGRDRLPILVGGSGLYVDSVLCDYSFAGAAAQPKLRAQLEKLSVANLQAEVDRQGLAMPQNKLNKRYLVRTLERGAEKPRRAATATWPCSTLVVGLKHTRVELERRIRHRLRAMLEAGLLEEARAVCMNYPAENEAAKSNIYAALRPYFAGHVALEQALEDFVKRDLALAKKQMTWFRRHEQINWFNDYAPAAEFIFSKLQVT